MYRRPSLKNRCSICGSDRKSFKDKEMHMAIHALQFNDDAKKKIGGHENENEKMLRDSLELQWGYL